MGDKYIIELEDKPFNKENGDFLYRVKGFNSLVFDRTGINKLIPYTEPDLGTLAKESFERGYRQRKAEEEKEIQEAYQRGLNDAWEAARKIADCFLWGSYQRETGRSSVCAQAVLDHYSASEAIEKIRQYEQEQQFHLGDEIETQNGFKGFVISADDKYVYFVNENGEGCVETMMAAKTGRHFPEIAEVLRKMKEG